MWQIPVRDVVSGIFEDPRLEERRSEIDPALVDEHSPGRVVKAIAPEAFAPPRKKRLRRLGGEREKAEVVDAREQQIAFVRTLAILRQWLGDVRREEHPALPRQRLERSERVEDLDIGIEI